MGVAGDRASESVVGSNVPADGVVVVATLDVGVLMAGTRGLAECRRFR